MVKKRVIERLKNTRKNTRNNFKEILIKRRVFIKNDSDLLDIDGSDESSNIRLFMDLDNHNDKFIKEEEVEVDLEA